MAQQSSNKTAYWIIGGILALVIVGFGGYKLWHPTSTPPVTVQNQQTQTGTSGSGSIPNKTDTSNQQLDQDAQNIQNSLNQLQQDQGTVNNDSTNQSQDVPQQ